MKIFDKLGMMISIGCMIHCLLLPIILPILPTLGFIFGHDGRFHLYLSALIICIACIALIPGYIKHKDFEPLGFSIMATIILVSAGIVELIIGHTLQIVLTTIVGSCTMVAAHWKNHKCLCRCEHHNKHCS